MIRKVHIANYKSIPELDLELGRLTVLIGANGSGKSNILEAIALASAAAENKLDNEFLASRGIRATEPRFMCSAFGSPLTRAEIILVSVAGGGEFEFAFSLIAGEGASYPRLEETIQIREPDFSAALRAAGLDPVAQPPEAVARILINLMERRRNPPAGAIGGFLIYSPENSVLRTFQTEGQILPLGIKGEGLFAHLKALDATAHRDRLDKIREHLALIDWFDTFVVPDDLGPGERRIGIRDRYLAGDVLFDQRSANEGFLFLLFYITLFVSPETPAFFAIDNIDSSLNPKLCTALVEHVAKLAEEYDKQVILTTHNPAVLDALDLGDPEQRLLVVDRDKDGHTRVRRVEAPKASPGHVPVSLSEAFLRGYIGGLPNNF